MLIKCLRRIFLAIFVLVLGITVSEIGESILRKNAQAMSSQETTTRLPPNKPTSTKARIDRLGADGKVKWSLEADRMEFSFDDNGEITIIDCFGNVVYSRGDVIVRSLSGQYNMTRKKFIFGGSEK